MRSWLIIPILFAFGTVECLSQTISEPAIKIGLLIPEDAIDDSIARSAVQGAELAISDLDLPVKLVVRSCNGPWGVTSKQVVEFVFEDEVDLIITSVDGRNAHLAEQVATKTHKVLIATRATDPTLTKAYVPWFFRMVGDDETQAKILVNEVFKGRDASNVVILSPRNYDAGYAYDSFINALDEEKKSRVSAINYDPLTSKFTDILEKIEKLKPGAIISLGMSQFTPQLLTMVSIRFREIPLFSNQALLATINPAKSLPGKILVVAPSGWKSQMYLEFEKRFMNRYGYKPGIVASFSYDAVIMASNVIRATGRDYVQIMKELKNYNSTGTSGKITFDEHGDRIVDLVIRTVLD